MSPSPVIRVSMWLFLAVIIIALPFSEGAGWRISTIESVSFSTTGSQVLVSRVDARDALTPFKSYVANVSRVVSVLSTRDGRVTSVVHRDFKPGVRGPAFGIWSAGRAPAVFNDVRNRVLVCDLDTRNLVEYAIGADTDPVGTPLSIEAVSVANSRSGTLIAITGGYGVSLLDASSNEIVREISFEGFSPHQAGWVAFSDDDSRLAVADWNGLHACAIREDMPCATVLQAGELRINAIAAGPRDSIVVCSPDGADLIGFDGVSKGSIDLGTHADSKYCRSCSASIAGGRMAFLTNNGIGIADPDPPFATSWIDLEGIRPTAVAVSLDGSMLAVGGRGGDLLLLERSSGKRMWKTSVPGRYRWPWTLPACALIVWGCVAWLVRKQLMPPSEHESR